MKENTDQAISFEKVASLEMMKITPSHNITLINPSGVEAHIDFNGDKVIYSGDLPVDESAKIFFDAVKGFMLCGN